MISIGTTGIECGLERYGGGLDLAVYQKNDFVFHHFLKGSFGEQEVRTITADRNHWMWVGPIMVFMYSIRILC